MIVFECIIIWLIIGIEIFFLCPGNINQLTRSIQSTQTSSLLWHWPLQIHFLFQTINGKRRRYWCLIKILHRIEKSTWKVDFYQKKNSKFFLNRLCFERKRKRRELITISCKISNYNSCNADNFLCQQVRWNNKEW